jgi:hypothetical protein
MILYRAGFIMMTVVENQKFLAMFYKSFQFQFLKELRQPVRR